MDELKERLEKALSSLPPGVRIADRVKSGKSPIGIVLGSGLGDLAAQVEDAHSIPFGDIQGLAQSTAPSHAGRLILGRYADSDVIMCEGRLHLYEGHSSMDVVMPVYLMNSLGVKQLIITNAAGGLNPAHQPGKVAIIEDHINFTGHNPLVGVDEPTIGVRFPDMSKAYDQSLRVAAKRAAKAHNIELFEGIYAGVIGPSLETSAERRFFRNAGADFVGMSTIMEVIAANHCSMDVLGLSVITNMATGGPDQLPDSLEAVLENARIGCAQLMQFFPTLIGELGE